MAGAHRPGTLAPWHPGTLALWHSGTLALWHPGTLNRRAPCFGGRYWAASKGNRMEHASYASRLRYLDADDVDDSVVDFDGLEVRGREGERLGDVNGFIVDLASGRV